MIVHCRSEMTETSSTHCLLRCFTRCFGIDRRGRENGIKTTLEPTQNGFSHLAEDEKTNGKATVVKIYEPNSNGISKPTHLKNVGEKTCCMPHLSSDESPYGYQPVPTEKVNGVPVIGKLDELPIDIDLQSDKTLIKTNGRVTPNGNIDCTSRLSNGGNQLELTDTGKPSSPDLLITSMSENVVPDQEMCSNTDFDILKDNKAKEDLEDMKNASPDSVICKPSCDVIDPAIEDSLLKAEGDSKVADSERVVSHSDIQLSRTNIVSDVQGDKKDTKVLQNGQTDAGEHSIVHFESLVEKETSNLYNLVQKWEKVLSDHPDVNEEVRDEIRSVNGQTHLVISERFAQFKSLVEQSESQVNGEQKGTKAITLTDLQGFWDMIFFQVQDVLMKFQRLDKVRINNWNPEILHDNEKKPAPKKNIRKPVNTRNKRTAKTTNGQSSSISEEEKARRIAARKRLVEARKRMAAQERTQSSNGGENFIVQ